MFESIIKKFKTFKKERRLSFLKDKRFEQYVVMICKLINLQIDLCKEHLSSKITKSKLKTILNSDWVYGYILGTTMAFINETYLRRKTRGHLFAMISVLHNLGIRDSKKPADHSITVWDYFKKEHENKDSEYQKGFTVGWDEYKNWLKESKDLKKIKKKLPCLELYYHIVKKARPKSTLSKKELSDKEFEKAKNSLLEATGMNAAEEEYKLIKNQGSGEFDYSLPDTYLNSAATLIAKWRYVKEEHSKTYLRENNVVRFIRLFLEREKKGKYIKDFNRVDAWMIWSLAMATPRDLLIKLVKTKIPEKFDIKDAKNFEKEIGYND